MQSNFKTTKPLIHYGILIFIYAVGIVTLASHTVLHALSGHDHSAATTTVAANTCAGTPQRMYRLNFTKAGIMPSTLSLNRCDEITITNNTIEEIIPALGPHEHHVHYPGLSEPSLQPGQSYSFRAVTAGTFPIHDHDDDTLTGTLVIHP